MSERSSPPSATTGSSIISLHQAKRSRSARMHRRAPCRPRVKRRCSRPRSPRRPCRHGATSPQAAPTTRRDPAPCARPARSARRPSDAPRRGPRRSTSPVCFSITSGTSRAWAISRQVSAARATASASGSASARRRQAISNPSRRRASSRRETLRVEGRGGHEVDLGGRRFGHGSSCRSCAADTRLALRPQARLAPGGGTVSRAPCQMKNTVPSDRPARLRPRAPADGREHRGGGPRDVEFRARPDARGGPARRLAQRARRGAGERGGAASGPCGALRVDVPEAIGDCTYVYATTARERGLTKPSSRRNARCSRRAR
jgi:hypothetical protein